MKKKIKALLLIVVISVALGACTKKDAEEIIKEEDYIAVEVDVIESKELSNHRVINGKVISDDEILISPEISGKVSQINVSLGDRVNKGDILFSIEKNDLERNLQQASISVDMAQKSLEQANNALSMSNTNLQTALANKEKAELDYQRSKELFEEGAISKSQLEQSELAYISADSQYKNAESQLIQSKINISQAEGQINQAKVSKSQITDNINKTVVRSPISGVVNMIDAKVGQMLSMNQAGMSIVNIDELYVQFEVIEDLVNKLKVSDNLLISIPSAVDTKLNGIITYISTKADVGNKLYSVRVKIDENIDEIKPGMTAEVEISLDKKENVIALDRSVILSDDDSDYVYIVEDNKSVRKEVKLGSELGENIEILEGLNIDDKVIIKGQHYLKDNQTVKIVGGNIDESI